MSDGRFEGGERALLGFYYQMIVTLSVATIDTKECKHDPTSGETRLHLKALGVHDLPLSLEHEGSGQDAVVRAGDVEILLQMKHSSNPQKYSFGVDDFQEVLGAFAHSHSQAFTSREKSADYFGLITNRPLTSWIDRIMKMVKTCATKAKIPCDDGSVVWSDDIKLWESEIFSYPNKADRKTIKNIVTNWLTVKKGKTIKHPNDNLVNAALLVFPRLFFVSPAPLEQWRDDFRAFAQRYGATDNEITGAEDRLLGLLIRQTSLPCRIDRLMLVKEITNYADALDLTPTPNGISARCVATWEDWADRNTSRASWIVQRRFDELDRLIREKRIIFLLGSGGTGKTVLLTQITSRVITRLQDRSQFDGFVTLGTCHELTTDWLERKIGKWAKRGSPGHESLSTPVERLKRANPDARVVLWIGLDGLDEEFPRSSDLKRLIEMATARNDVCVIFTCRSDGRERVMTEFIHRNETGFPPNVQNDAYIAEITVPDFREWELLDAIEQCMGMEARERVAYALGQPLLTLDVPADRTDEKLLRVVQSLRHPRMFGALAWLVENKKEAATGVLDTDPVALGALAQAFLGSFMIKYDHRRRELELPDREYLLEVIRTIAAQTQADLPFSTEEWIRAAREIVDNRVAARKMLKEAISGGLVEAKEDSRSFTWKHMFVAEYLVRSNKDFLDESTT